MGAQSNHNGSLNEEEEGEEHHKDTTLQDFYFQHPNDTDSDSDTDDDHDWQPSNIPFHLDDSFCINCTMRVDATHSHSHSSCKNCGEAMASQLNGYEAFQSQFLDAITRYNASSSSSSTGFGFDERMLLHKEIEMKNHPHPERPDRLQAIAASLTEAGIFPEKCTLIPAREITREELLNVHSLDNVDSVEQTKNMFYSYFTPDTYANAFSACAAKLAAGICADLATSIMSGQFKNGFALVRPPGHHATITQAMGFCLHNNAAVAAIAAQKAGARKVLIVDWGEALLPSLPPALWRWLLWFVWAKQYVCYRLASCLPLPVSLHPCGNGCCGCPSWQWNTGNIRRKQISTVYFSTSA